MSAPKFEPVPRLPAHHLHGASLQDGPQLLTVTALGDSVALHATVGGVSAMQVMRAPVARAVGQELLAAAAVFDGVRVDGDVIAERGRP